MGQDVGVIVFLGQDNKQKGYHHKLRPVIDLIMHGNIGLAINTIVSQ